MPRPFGPSHRDAADRPDPIFYACLSPVRLRHVLRLHCHHSIAIRESDVVRRQTLHSWCSHWQENEKVNEEARLVETRRHSCVRRSQP